LSITARQALEVFSRAERLHDPAAVEAALDRMAEMIARELRGTDPLVITIMQGGVVTTGLLLPRLDFPLQVDYLHATRYSGGTRGGDIQWIVRPTRPLLGRTLLLIDDIFDEGHTLAAIRQACLAAGARRVYSAVLVDKRHDRKADYQPDFVGLEVGDRYVFGYGMDYCEYLRNAPGIYAVREEDA
jgi:hypoxanthine phosphoribosyltransferase